jgi:hypothetical protein
VIERIVAISGLGARADCGSDAIWSLLQDNSVQHHSFSPPMCLAFGGDGSGTARDSW